MLPSVIAPESPPAYGGLTPDDLYVAHAILPTQMACEIGNTYHGPDARKVVVIRAEPESDCNGALRSLASRLHQNIAQINLNHPVDIRFTSKASEFGSIIRQYKGQADRFIVYAHGAPHRFTLSEGMGGFFSLKDVKQEDWSGLTAPVFFVCCELGQQFIPELSQKLASWGSAPPLYGSTQPIQNTDFYVLETAMTSFNASEVSHFRRFENGVGIPVANNNTCIKATECWQEYGAERDLVLSDPEKVRDATVKLEGPLKKAANKGHAASLRALSRAYRENWLSSHGDLPLEVVDRMIAAHNGNLKAQLEVAGWYENGTPHVKRSKETAMRYYRLAAANGDRLSQIRVFFEIMPDLFMFLFRSAVNSLCSWV